LDELSELDRQHPWRSGEFAGLVWRWRDTGGRGRPLLLLPGALGTADVFVRQLPLLAPARRCVAVDYPAGTPDRLADGLAELISDGLGVPRADGVGASFGGWWLQLACARHPWRFGAVVLANSFASGRHIARHALFDPTMLETEGPLGTQRRWAEALRSTPDAELRELQLALLDRQQPSTLHGRLLAVARAEAPPPLPPHVGRTVIECSDDPIVRGPTADELRRHVGPAQVVRLPIGGHYPHVLAAAAYAGQVLSATEFAYA
jgi:pimeloyl-ACP methyl ester carboxylesterase